MSRHVCLIAGQPVFCVDGTPDRDLPRRILSAHLQNSRTCRLDTGTALDAPMNDMEAARAKAFTAALKRLGGPVELLACDDHKQHLGLQLHVYDKTPDSNLAVRTLYAYVPAPNQYWSTASSWSVERSVEDEIQLKDLNHNLARKRAVLERTIHILERPC